MTDWLNNLHPFLLSALKWVVFYAPVFVALMLVIWWERRLLAWMQDRIGPNRVGPFGLLQPMADGVKLFFKEDITPSSVDRKLYFIAPAIALFPAFALGATVPWGPSFGVYGVLTPIASVDIGLLYILAVSSLGVYGVVLSGYASNNKYSLMGGLRASAQLISYELAMGVSLACIVMATGSLRLVDIVREQEKPLWDAVPALQNWFILTPFGFIAAVIFAICIVAETNRAPFDLPEAENELVAGYHTEYSSMKFAAFFMGEYVMMFLFSGVFAAVFLGGYNALPVNWAYLANEAPALSGVFRTLDNVSYWAAPLFFFFKCFLGVTAFVWIRATLPRLRYDQLMALGWKSLLPIGVANLIVVALWIVATKLYGPAGGLLAALGAIGLAVLIYLNVVSAGRRGSKPAIERRTIELR